MKLKVRRLGEIYSKHTQKHEGGGTKHGAGGGSKDARHHLNLMQNTDSKSVSSMSSR